MNGTTMLKLAAQLAKGYEQDYLNWASERDGYLAEGYRGRYCEHGMNMWVDYDPICQGCEDGWTMSDPMQRRRRAIDEAKSRLRELDQIADLIADAARLNLTYALDMPALRKRCRDLLTW